VNSFHADRNRWWQIRLFCHGTLEDVPAPRRTGVVMQPYREAPIVKPVIRTETAHGE